MTYLLKADDEAMARWKEDARRADIPFAEHVRRCLNGATPSAPAPARRSAPPAPGEKKTYEPDPKR